MKHTTWLCALLLFLLPLVAKGQQQVTLDESQQEIAKVIKTVMHISEQDATLAQADATTRKAVEVVRAFTGQKEYSEKMATDLAAGLTLEDNHIIILPKYQRLAEGATWDGVSLAEFVKAIDDFRSMGLTGQQQVALDESQQEIAKVIKTVMHISEQDATLAQADATTRKAVEVVRAFTGQKEYSEKMATDLAAGLTLEDNHIIILPKYQRLAEGATWDGVSLAEFVKAIDDFRSMGLTGQQ